MGRRPERQRRLNRPPKFTRGDLVDAEVGYPPNRWMLRGGRVLWAELRDNGIFEYYAVYVDFPENTEPVVYAEDQLRGHGKAENGVPQRGGEEGK